MKDINIIKGCMIGGAIGDALGYPIEFDSYKTIVKKYGMNGLDHYILEDGKALISDDTQMSLFTAIGLLNGNFHVSVYEAYLDWLYTQMHTKPKNDYWLLSCKELYARRAPGNTCLDALQSKKMGTIENPINQSKGCGGIMRVAPLALYDSQLDDDALDLEGARIAAITHGHSLGYMSAAALVHILHHIILEKDKSNFDLYQIMEDTIQSMKKLFKNDKHLSELVAGMENAIILSKNRKSDIENIKELGQGWVGEEALFISMYCALKYSNNFDAAMIAAVNHSGDSDSTGAITGNIVGALVGYDSIGKKWIENLECLDILFEISDNLYKNYSSQNMNQ